MPQRRADLPLGSGSRSFDLHVESGGSRIRESLESSLREAVRSGRLKGGTRLPSSRSLADDLGISRTTVMVAYDQLIAEGWLSARQGSGTWVTEGRALDSIIGRRAEIREEPGVRYDMSPGVPDVSNFPRSAWMAAASRAITNAPDVRFAYGDARGTVELRQALAEYLTRSRGVSASVDRIVICSGAVQALGVLGHVMSDLEVDTVAVESACFYISQRQMERAGFDLVPLTIDDEGARIDELVGSKAQTVLLTPAHQFPWGVALNPERRAEVIRWARDTGGLVIEDDYDGEFRYDRRPIGALQGGAPEEVIYLGSASKALAPGLRLGWMVLPEHLIDKVLERRITIDLHTGVFEQLTMAEFITTGAYDRHIRASRLHYQKRRDELQAMIHEHSPHVRVSGIAAGLHALLTLPGDLALERATVDRARQNGLVLVGLSSFRIAPKPSDQAGLVVGYGATPGHAFSAAVDVLRQTLESTLPPPSSVSIHQPKNSRIGT